MRQFILVNLRLQIDQGRFLVRLQFGDDAIDLRQLIFYRLPRACADSAGIRHPADVYLIKMLPFLPDRPH